MVVLELPQAVLQLLEVADDLAVGDRVVQRREELQHVAQFLGALAQVVQGFRRRVSGDRGAVRGELAEGAAGPVHGQVVRGQAAALGAALLGVGQRPAPVLGQGPEAGRAQPGGQPAELPGAAADQEGAERLQVGGRRGHQLPGHRVEAEQVDIQVADRRGQVAEPLELGRVPAAQAVREHVAEQLDRRAGAAGGDPQVVQELGVDVAQHAIDVALHGVEQPEQQGRDRDRGRLLRGDLRGDAVAVVRRVAAEGVQGVEERAAPGRGRRRERRPRAARPGGPGRDSRGLRRWPAARAARRSGRPG